MLLFTSKAGPSYGRLSQDSQNDIEEDVNAEKTRQSRSLITHRAWCIHTVLLLVSSTLFIHGLLAKRVSFIARTDEPAQWSKELSSIPKITTRFRGSFTASSKFRGSSPEATKEWERFTYSPFIDGTAVILGVTEEEIRKSNKVADEEWFNTTVVLQEGNGKEKKYMATLEVFHQMHCLEMLRKATFMDVFKDDMAWKDADVKRKHLDHCIEIIRQVVMCNSDPRLITFHWVKNNPVPYPDFNTWHQCRDVDATLDWGERNNWTLEQTVKKNGGEVEMPHSP